MISAPEIPGHTVTGILGSGGFATVYRTWQDAVGRETAVKVDSRVLHTERDQRRFFREVTAAGRLSGHPHVIGVYDAGTLRDGRPYLVMELCPDGSLQDELRRRGPMSPARACRIGASLADALAAAHAAGILHRDIKPANILINRYGVVGLSDFGLASIIAAGGEQSVTREALTPAFAPPESFRAADPTAAADLYSLAATLYALMAGRPPRFPADGRSPAMATILALHGQPVEDIPGVPAPMLDILRQCLAADPAQRLPSAAALRDQLDALGGQPNRGPARFMPSAASVPHAAAPGPGRAASSSLPGPEAQISGPDPAARPAAAAGPAAAVGPPECWDGLDETEGVITVSSLPCTGPHTWQTFAIGIMPGDASAYNVNIVQANPTVQAVCSYQVLLRSRLGRARLIPRSRWSLQVVPPDEAAYYSGARTYRCMAALGYGQSRTSQFG